MLPNIVITGTPGCGKSSLAASLANAIPGTVHVNLSAVIKEKKMYSEWDDELNASIFDEDLVADYIDELYESRLEQGGIILDFHSVGFLPATFFDKVFVLRCETSTLWDRLLARGYSHTKIQENIDCEIFGSCLEEAHEIFQEVEELQSNDQADALKNLEILCAFTKAFSL